MSLYHCQQSYQLINPYSMKKIDVDISPSLNWMALRMEVGVKSLKILQIVMPMI